MIKTRNIGTIACEVTKNGRRNIYRDLPDNSESGLLTLLGEHHELVAKGWERLEDGKIEDVPESWWEMDVKWRARTEGPAGSDRIPSRWFG